MKDRIPAPGKEGRVKLTLDDGSAIEGVLEMSDDATEPGTAWSKGNVLSDISAARFGLDNSAVPNDMWQRIVLPQLIVTTKPGASVTATLGDITIGPVAADEEGLAILEVTGYGDWTVTAERSGKTHSETVTVDEVRQYALKLLFSPLPDGYTQLEYIESTGTQYINTDVTPSASDIEIKATVMFLAENTNGFLMGISTKSTETANMLCFGAKNNKVSLTVYGVGSGTSTAYTDGQKADIIWKTSGSTSTISGDFSVTYTESRIASGSWRNGSLYLFAAFDGTTLRAGKYRYYDQAEVIVGNKVTRSFYPARRDSDGAVGLYDLVSGILKTSESSTPFIAGPEA